MLTDALVNFANTPLSLVAGAGVAIPSSVYDILGQGVGTVPDNIIGTRSTFGSDVGIGDPRPQLEVLVTTAFATGNVASLQVQFQAAPEDATTHLPTAWTTLIETDAIAVASLTLGQVLAKFDFPPEFPQNLNPRFLRLNFVVPAGTNFTAGAILAPVTTVRDDLTQFQTPKNFAVKGLNG